MKPVLLAFLVVVLSTFAAVADEGNHHEDLTTDQLGPSIFRFRARQRCRNHSNAESRCCIHSGTRKRKKNSKRSRKTIRTAQWRIGESP